MKKVYLIHGWGGRASGNWFDWIRKELEGKAEIRAFDMPDTDHPNIERWVSFMQENVKTIDKETYFIGHSIGCQAILRFLERLPEDVKIAGCVFVAGFFNLKPESYSDDEEKAVARPWIETPIDFDIVKQHCTNFLALFSDNDPYVPLSDEKLFKKNLSAKTIIMHGLEHFNKRYELPDLMKFIKA
jgi:predicted alpha/beta hydrolase family esterase